MDDSQEKIKKNSIQIAEKFRQTIRSEQMDFWLLLSIILLVGMGTMMVFSASSAAAYRLSTSSSAYTILTKQILFAVGGTIIMLIIANWGDYKLLSRFSIPLYGVSIILLILVLLIGSVYNNAKRWLNIGVEFQPSEVFKIALIFFLAYVFSRPGLAFKAQRLMGLVIYFVPAILGLLLIAAQPHMSCVVICLFVLGVMMIMGKVRMPTYIALIILAGLFVLGLILITKYFPNVFDSDKFSLTYIVDRIKLFFDKESSGEVDNYQIEQSLYAIGSGGLFGRGFGQGVQKYMYLPEPYNDFIFSILAEELGFVGVTIVICLFALFIFRGYKIAVNAPDRLGSLLATGITSLIAIQVIMNLAVVSKSMPVTGISLPLFSYGGTSLVILMAAMGVLLNISKQSHYNKF